MFTSKFVAAASLLLFAGVVSGQGTITAGGASYVHTATHWDITPETHFTGVGTGDQLFEDGWWFRIEGDTQETVFPAPGSASYTGDTATIAWPDLGGRSLAVTQTVVVSSAAAGQGETSTTIAVTNNSAATITLHLFQMIDLDINGSAGGDSATLIQANNFIRVTDATTGQCEFRGVGAVGYLVLPFAATTDVAAQLSNTTVTNFTNTGLPFGPGDFTGGLQWTLQLAPGASGTVLSYTACNQASTPVSLQHFEID